MSSEANLICACWRCGDRPDDGTAHMTIEVVPTPEDDPTTIDEPPTTGA